MIFPVCKYKSYDKDNLKATTTAKFDTEQNYSFIKMLNVYQS